MLGFVFSLSCFSCRTFPFLPSSPFQAGWWLCNQVMQTAECISYSPFVKIIYKPVGLKPVGLALVRKPDEPADPHEVVAAVPLEYGATVTVE